MPFTHYFNLLQDSIRDRLHLPVGVILVAKVKGEKKTKWFLEVYSIRKQPQIVFVVYMIVLACLCVHVHEPSSKVQRLIEFTNCANCKWPRMQILNGFSLCFSWVLPPD